MYRVELRIEDKSTSVLPLCWNLSDVSSQVIWNQIFVSMIKRNRREWNPLTQKKKNLLKSQTQNLQTICVMVLTFWIEAEGTVIKVHLKKRRKKKDQCFTQSHKLFACFKFCSFIISQILICVWYYKTFCLIILTQIEVHNPPLDHYLLAIGIWINR